MLWTGLGDAAARWCKIVSAVGLLALAPHLATGASLTVQQASWDPANFSVHVYVSNEGNAPCGAIDLHVTAGATREEARALPLHWSRIRPNPVPVGGHACVTACLRDVPEGNVALQLALDDGSVLETEVALRSPELTVAFIAADEARRGLRAYVQSTSPTGADDRLTGVRLDGQELGASTAIGGDGRLFRGWVALDLPMPSAASPSGYHVLEVETETGARTHEQFRVCPVPFLLGAYGALNHGVLADMAAHSLNHYACFGRLSPTDLRLLDACGLTAGCTPFADSRGAAALPPSEAARERGIVPRLLAQYGSAHCLRYVCVMEEPDYRDYFETGLGFHAPEAVQRAALCNQHAPELPTLIQIDNTYRYANYRVYGEIADACASNRYALGRGAAVSEIAEACDMLRATSQPRPWFFIPQFFRLSQGEGDDRLGRMPALAEMQLQCYVALAHGARGIIYYCHSGDSRGGEGPSDAHLWDAMGPLHRALRQVGDVIAHGNATDWIECDSPLVAARAIACPPEAVLLVVYNRGVRSDLDNCLVPVARDVDLTLHLPPWLTPAALTDGQTGKDIPYETSEAGLRCR
ncbi:MAG: hypothetical protein FJX74_12475, partial [Armatimonadetes bacterium]|nr:hypothetical protein [Armatimonadota bacterium]